MGQIVLVKKEVSTTPAPGQPLGSPQKEVKNGRNWGCGVAKNDPFWVIFGTILGLLLGAQNGGFWSVVRHLSY